jgi:hypothetical protein
MNGSPARARARFVVRLREADLGTERFIDVMDGTKVSNDYQRFEPDSDRLNGNYAIYPGYGGKPDSGYVVEIDIDDYEGEHETESVDALPDTLTVSTPHGGEHRFYALPEDPVATLKQEFGVRNPVPSFGELRIQNGYVLGPGSVLDSCDKEWHDCSKPGEGNYHISENRPIAEIGVDDLVEVVRADPQYSAEPSKYEQMTFDTGADQ